jgi:hypothetical protein
MKLSSFIIHLFPFNLATNARKIHNINTPICESLIKKCVNAPFSTEKTFIKNTELPICANCVHFIEHKNNYPYDPLPNAAQQGRCKKFGEVNMITGLIDYDFAKYCREDLNKCGKSGSEYVEKVK